MMDSQSLHRWVSLATFVGLVGLVAAVGAYSGPGEWYARLIKPAWTPASWVFGPVWTVLYLMIAVAGWLCWWAPEGGSAIRAWIAQLVFNAAWSIIFFGFNLIGVALIDIGLLWLSIVAFMISAWEPSRIAALLFVPYLAWVSYAAVLNILLWQLNA